MVWTYDATCKDSQSIGQSQSVDEFCYTFSTENLQEQGHKSYVASYWENEELVIPQMTFLVN